METEESDIDLSWTSRLNVVGGCYNIKDFINRIILKSKERMTKGTNVLMKI